MCKTLETIRFCSCADNLESATKHAKSIYYVWTMEHATGFNDIAMDGLLMAYPEQLDELYAEFIVKELNSKNVFDFDYQPKENDSLRIERVNPKKRYEKKELIGDHLNFYFKFDEWQIGYPTPFTYEYEIYKNGNVEIIKK